jgi:hypothetical protein
VTGPEKPAKCPCWIYTLKKQRGRDIFERLFPGFFPRAPFESISPPPVRVLCFKADAHFAENILVQYAPMIYFPLTFFAVGTVVGDVRPGLYRMLVCASTECFISLDLL